MNLPLGVKQFVRYLVVACLGLFYALWFVGANVRVDYIEGGKVIPQSKADAALVERWMKGQGVTRATFISLPGDTKVRLNGNWVTAITLGFPSILVVLTWVLFGGKSKTPPAMPVGTDPVRTRE